MIAHRGLVPIIAGALLISAPATGQDEGNAVPTIEVESWTVLRAPKPTSTFQTFTLTPDQVPSFVHQERDCLVVQCLILDDDWSLPDEEGQGELNAEEVFVRLQAFSYPTLGNFGVEQTDDVPCGFVTQVLLAPDIIPAALQSPAAPQISDSFPVAGPFCPPTVLGEFFGQGDRGFAPVEDPEAPNGLSLRLLFVISLPEFIGKNQNRLRGLIDHDIAYLLEFSVANSQGPQEPAEVACALADVKVIESPELAPANPQPIADAGVDRTVPTGRTVILDASRTFDSTNVGFDPTNPNVFEKDALTFVWEWVSGPERVDPVQESVFEPTATVVFQKPDPDNPYVYQVTVTDRATSAASTDTVNITVLDPSEFLPNRSPRAVISGVAQVTVGSVVTLSGQESSDPDGDVLRFRWAQVNELGLPIASSQLQEEFQPLSGLSQPVVTWQANRAGTFFVRLLVDDGELTSAVTTSVRVVAGEAAETPAAGDDSAGRVTDDSAEEVPGPAPVAPGICGAGIVSAGLTPLVLAMWRIRRR